MPEANPAALEFLLSRRSRPAKTLGLPVPRREELLPLLTAAARSPDHGKLEPWRFIVLERPALERLASRVPEVGEAAGRSLEDIAKQRSQYDGAHLVVAVVSSPKPSPKIPKIEQLLSAGAVCLALLNAALAAGWGANWLTGWAVHERRFAERELGLAEGEQVAGLIHIGTETAAPPERPRPDLGSIVSWITA
ncbi:nitroreductase family protein [Roseitranquillus sediminis]|uniref:nitroreductase family protein n=1 Tax=Roseitranquillus sediminis TaxID=2809051 RepID=UPI001D0C5A9B|nr:nitroreductase [Roseitranquillus sediminis]MBM9594960.1 nitroreductase [Roseitranquillus sediminis]